MICISDFELDIVLDIIKKYASDCDVLAFGSRYKWTPKDYSDLDLAFVQKEGGKLGLNRIGDLKEAFSESDLPYRVDVLDYNAISPEFRAIIDRGNEVIYKGCKNLRQAEVKLRDACKFQTLQEQRLVAGILNAVDNKIAINTKINHHLEQIAQVIWSDRFGFTSESLYVLLKQTSVTSIVTRNVQPKIDRAGLKTLSVVIPCEEEMREFNTLIEPMFAQIRNNRDECLCLAALRDALSPCLMSMEGEANSERVDFSSQG